MTTYDGPFTLRHAAFLDGMILPGQAGRLRGNGPDPAPTPPPGSPLVLDTKTSGRTAGTKDSNTHGSGLAGIGFTNLVLTTTMTNDIIVVISNNETDAAARTITGVTSASGLSFTRIGGTTYHLASGHYLAVEMWWALAAAVLTNEEIVIHWSGLINNAAHAAVAINGANLAAPVDVNANAVVTAGTDGAGGPFVSLSTSHDNAYLLVEAVAQGVGSDTMVNSGWSLIGIPGLASSGLGNNAGSNAAGKIVSSTQTGLSLPGSYVGAGPGLIMAAAIQGSI